MTFRINPFTGELDFYDVTKYTSSTGVASGGILSADVSNTTFSITAGTGTYVDSTTNAVTNVIWAEMGNIPVTYLLTNLVTYVAITPTGTVLQQVSPFTNSQSRDNIILGAVVHTNLTTINAVNQTQHVVLNPANQVADLQNSLGFFNVSGNIYSPNGVNLNLNKSTGIVHKTGSNWDIDQKNPNVKTLASGTAITFRYRLQDGTESANTTVIDPSNYDVAGVLTSVPLGKFTVQRINVFSSNITRIQYGQNLYNGLSDALAAIQTEIFITETNIAQNGLLRGFLVVRGLATDLTSANTYFLEAPKFGGVGGIGGLSTTTMQGAYDNSTTPEIVTSTTNGAISIKRGTAADTDSVVEIQNGAGSITASITGAGVLTSSNVTGPSGSLSIGDLNTASGLNSIAIGTRSSTFSQNGRKSWSSNNFTTTGDSQESIWGMRAGTTDATPTRLSSASGTGSTAASNTNQVFLQDNNVFFFEGHIVAKQTASTNCGIWKVDGVIVRGTSAATTTLVTSSVTSVSNVAGWGTPTLTADTTLGCLNITVTGLTATSIRWTANIKTVETIFV